MKFEDCRFGLVVRHWSYGIGMIEVLVPKNQTVNVCFESECVNMSPYDLELIGDIRIFEAFPTMARAAEIAAAIEEYRTAEIKAIDSMRKLES